MEKDNTRKTEIDAGSGGVIMDGWMNCLRDGVVEVCGGPKFPGWGDQGWCVFFFAPCSLFWGGERLCV